MHRDESPGEGSCGHEWESPFDVAERMGEMIECANVRLPLDAGLPDDVERLMRKAAARACGVDAGKVAEVRLLRRSVDARRKSDVHLVP